MQLSCRVAVTIVSVLVWLVWSQGLASQSPYPQEGLIKTDNGWQLAPGYEFIGDPSDLNVRLKRGLVRVDKELNPAPGYDWVDPTDKNNLDVRPKRGLVATDNGTLRPSRGYDWVNPKEKTNFDVRPERGLVANANATLSPAPGYDWQHPDDKDNVEVRPERGLIAEPDGTLRPAGGYEWVYPNNKNNFAVRTKRGLIAEADWTLRPAGGYEWVNRQDKENFDVRVKEGLIANADRTLSPARGYEWVDRNDPHDFRVRPAPQVQQSRPEARPIPAPVSPPQPSLRAQPSPRNSEPAVAAELNPVLPRACRSAGDDWYLRNYTDKPVIATYRYSRVYAGGADGVVVSEQPLDAGERRYLGCQGAAALPSGTVRYEFVSARFK